MTPEQDATVQAGADEWVALVSFQGPAGIVTADIFLPALAEYPFMPYRSGAHAALYWALKQGPAEVMVTCGEAMEQMVAIEMSVRSIMLAPPSEGRWKRIPVLVLARLTADTLRVFLWPEQGLADGGVPVEIPLDLVPPDLRMPNSEFDLLVDGLGTCDWSRARVARRSMPDPQEVRK